MDTSLLEKFKNTKLGEKKMDTSLALEFIKNNIVSDEWNDHDEMFIVKKTNEITKCNIAEFSQYLDSFKICTQDAVQAGRKLAKKIEENAEMFVQLEYLARGTDGRDVRDGHVKLMSQLLRCGDALWNYDIHWNLFVTESMPLYNLASVVACRYSDISAVDNLPKVIKVVDKKMKYLCLFFVQLCREVGFEVPLVFTNKRFPEVLVSNKLVWQEHLAENRGCTGVIAEFSDLDSAIDTFIQSSVTAPWRLQLIYVQESVFGDFRNAFAAKARVPPHSREVLVGDKTFLIEPLMATDAGIPVFAYRTTKELLSLLQTPYLSVWAADSALSNEVALNAPAHTVWVNDYGSFDGPPRAALSVYNLYAIRLTETHKTNVKESLKSWAKMQATDRLEVIISVIEASEMPDVKSLLPDFTVKWRSDDFIHVTDKTVSFGIQKHIGLIHVTYLNTITKLSSVIKILVNGNGVICNGGSFGRFADELNKNGVPIVHHDHATGDKLTTEQYPLIRERLKVIRTNYGTIFAN